MKPNQYDVQLMKVVKTLREREGFKLINLANPLGIDRSTYGRIEKGELGFTPGQLKIMAHQLKTNHYQLQLLVDTKDEKQGSNTSLSAMLIKLLKLIDDQNTALDFNEDELHYVISILTKKYEDMQKEEPSLHYAEVKSSHF